MTMTPQERDVIAGIFDRLKPAATQPRDPEAEKLIAEKLKDQPYAPYAMAQSVYVQEQALTNMQRQVEELQAQVVQLQQQAQTAAPAQPQGGFLSGMFGGGSKPAAMQAPAASGGRPGGPWGSQAAQPQPQPQAAGPWGGQPQQAAPAAGGGFMATALTTAAGVAGGMVVGNMLMNAFKGPSAATGATQANNSGGAAGEPASQTASLSDQSANGTTDASSNYSEASYNEPAADYGADDGGDEWA
jgi:uncharacterized protein